MLEVVYTPDQKIELERYVVISDYAELLEFIKYNKIKLLSIPANDEAYDIIDAIIKNKIDIKTIHIQSTTDVLGRLKIFFELAKQYSENQIKRDVILKHEYLDTQLQKNKKKD